MKQNLRKVKLFGLFSITSYMTYSQTTPVGNPPANNTNAKVDAAWYRGGNVLGTLPNNIFGFTASNNSTIWHQTNGFNRMVMWNGNGNQTDGKVGIGNNLDNSFIPQSRLHLRQMGYIL